MNKVKIYFVAMCFVSLFLLPSQCWSEILKKEGEGFLEKQGSQLILHVKGSSYEMGYQHGVLLKPMIRQIVLQFLEGDKSDFAAGRFAEFEKAYPNILQFIPKAYLEEMKGLADGSDVPLEKIQRLNLFPEMFHCSGIIALPQTTKDQTLYHARVLDYAVGAGLEKVSVLMVVEPQHAHAFLSISYPGFIGCVTGMNEEQISLGEIGGLGYGKWEGCPMSFLMRSALEKASTLEEAKAVFASTQRTCEYYYLIADGKDKSAIALYATPSQVQWIEPGSSYALIPSDVEKTEKIVFSPFSFYTSEGLAILYDEAREARGLFFHQPKRSLILTGYPKPERYRTLHERFSAAWGEIDLISMQQMITPPVTCSTNLHNAIFEPSKLAVTLSHAKNGEPASLNTYETYHLDKLLQTKAK
jgi:hypothetical protein